MDANNDLVKGIKELEKKGESEKIEPLIEKMLQQDPNNIDLWMRLAVFELNAPFYDEDKSIECLEKVLKLEKDHPIALLILSDAQVRRFGNMDEKLKDKLATLVTNSPEINSMFRYAASEFYRYSYDNNKTIQEKLLKESIKFYQGHVWNYVRLADLYFEKGQKLEAKKLIEKALKNVRKVFNVKEWDYDPTDANELLYAFFNGLELTTEWYEDIKKKLDN